VSHYARLRAAIDGRRMPLALVDLDALDRNTARIAAVARAAGKRLRVATKSIRSPALIDRILEAGGDGFRGLMSFAVAEAAALVERGHRDLLVAYPSVQPADLEQLGALNRAPDTRVALVVDGSEHVDALAAAGRRAGAELPAIVEIDLSLRLFGGAVHLGVYRSPVRSTEAAVALARLIDRTDGVSFAGLMGYEAQVAGIGERNPFTRLANPAKRAIRRASVPAVARRRAEVAAALVEVGLAPAIFNGGGTGSLAATCAEPAVTEVTAGSGFLCSHLFDYYPDLDLEPAAFFALQVVRRPEPRVVTCHGGGYVASGEAGRDRLPIPVEPPGLSLTRLEGAGEVQTPIQGAVADLSIGDPVFFRHAKAGELAEHFDRYLLISGDEVVGEARTYRGLGMRFL
jgi:D-serine deaminase-like pyridoxal phosphate-dependent protein